MAASFYFSYFSLILIVCHFADVASTNCPPQTDETISGHCIFILPNQNLTPNRREAFHLCESRQPDKNSSYSWHLPKMDSRKKNQELIDYVSNISQVSAYVFWIDLKQSQFGEWRWASDNSTFKNESIPWANEKEPNDEKFGEEEIQSWCVVVVRNFSTDVVWKVLLCDFKIPIDRLLPGGKQIVVCEVTLKKEESPDNAQLPSSTTPDSRLGGGPSPAGSTKDQPHHWQYVLLGIAIAVALICGILIVVLIVRRKTKEDTSATTKRKGGKVSSKKIKNKKRQKSIRLSERSEKSDVSQRSITSRRSPSITGTSPNISPRPGRKTRSIREKKPKPIFKNLVAKKASKKSLTKPIVKNDRTKKK